MDDGGRRCALPGCDRVIAAADGRPERRYCTAAHRGAARQARRAAAQAQRAEGPDAWAASLPWLREPAGGPAAAAVEVPTAEPVAESVTAEPGPRRPHRRPAPRKRALAVLGVAGLLAGGYAATAAPPSPAPVQATVERESPDSWADRASGALASVDRELAVLEQAEQEWRRLPEGRRAVVPAPVVALEERRAVLQRRRAVLQSQLDGYRSLRRAQQELAVAEQQLRAVEDALADASSDGRGAGQDAALAALAEQRDLRLRRRDAQRAELVSLEEAVAAAMRAPLPDDGDVTETVAREVRDVVGSGGAEPAPGPTVAPEEGGPAAPPGERQEPGARPDVPAPAGDHDTLAELRERAIELARELRRAEAAG